MHDRSVHKPVSLKPLLIAVSTWGELLAEARCTLELRGDALGVLQAVLSRRARCPAVNSIIAEVQLLLGKSMFDLFAAHVWSEENEVADALSRLSEGALFPQECSAAKKCPAKRRTWRFVRKPQ